MKCMRTHPTAGRKKIPKRRLAATKRITRSPAPPPADSGYDNLAPPYFMKERTLTVREASYRLGKSTDSIRQWLRQGRLRGWQVGGPFCQVLVSAASVDEVLITRTTRFGR